MRDATATTLTEMCSRRMFRWATSAMVRMANDIHSQTTRRVWPTESAWAHRLVAQAVHSKQQGKVRSGGSHDHEGRSALARDAGYRPRYRPHNKEGWRHPRLGRTTRWETPLVTLAGE